MASTSPQHRPKAPVPIAPCDECHRRKIKCDRVFPQCGQCRNAPNGIKTCVFPGAKRGRWKRTPPEQHQLLSDAKWQPQGEGQLYISSGGSSSATDSKGTARLDTVLSKLVPGSPLPSSTSASRKPKRIAQPPAVIQTRVRRRKQNGYVGLASPKRRIRDKELIHAAQASSRKGTSAPSKQSQSDLQDIPKSPTIPVTDKGEHPSNKAPRDWPRGRPKKIQPVDDGKNEITCVCGGAQKIGETSICCEKCESWHHTSCVKFTCESCAIETAQKQGRNNATQTDDSAGDSILHLQTSLEGARDEIQLLQEKIARKEDETQEQANTIDTLQNEKATMYLAQTERDKHHKLPLENLADYYEGRLRELQKELDSREILGIFTRQSWAHCEGFGRTRVAEGIKEAYASSRQTLCRYDNGKAPFIRRLDQHEMLLSLVYKSLGLSDARFDALDQATDMLSKLSLQALIRALTVTAMKVWVFQTDFPRFDAGSSMVLQGTRDCIRNQDSPLALRNIDLATHSHLVTSKDFREKLVPQKAIGLAIQLSSTLAPLFSDASHRPSPSDWDGFSTWGEGIEQWRERRLHFIDMFTHALITKADSCLNSRDYEMVTYLPGTPFDKTTMKAQTIDGAPNSAMNHYGRQVQLCVEAALFTHPVREIHRGTSVADAIVSTTNFISRDQNEKRAFEPLVKAVVILSEDN